MRLFNTVHLLDYNTTHLRRENQLFFWCFTLIYIYEDIKADIGIKAGVYDITEKSELELA